ncbi:hypothetical protein F5883DRAFT_593943 [Diaporthe sp. PMI_573]|nr:hypothetical protein F5883DRAFT_596650 [Diaporthaceae sp. PMI_573]KAH8743147.1 hypothetical protein F5883DRAFT_593943 [Diaporthaceae sp. PMI_573]
MTPAAIRFRLIFRVPLSEAEACKKAIFAAGAGRYPGPGQYTECCFSSTGTGQFRPGDTANPNIGSVGQIEKVPEMRIETSSPIRGAGLRGDQARGLLKR